MKVLFFGVRDVERELFEKLSSKYNYELKLATGVISLDRIDLLDGVDVVVVRGQDKVNKEIIDAVKSKGIKYLFTRTVGYDHIDITYAKEQGLKLARVASYSPTAIAELAVSMAHSLTRKSLYFAHKALSGDLTVDPNGFSKELKNSTVAIIGTGKIGFEAAKMFKGLGARVVGYDLYPNESFKDVIEYLPLDQALSEADVVSFHMPYFKGQNDEMINKDLIAKMKDGAVLINTARGQIQNNQDIIEAIRSNKLYGAGIDVLNYESEYFGKKLDANSQFIKDLNELFPRLLVSPHIGSYTDEAALNMIEYTLDNINEYTNTGDCKNKL
ncbi:lactate dehydrogenase [Mycoplasmopsis anatis]|uniref:D-lactate dehydrogenase n=1 Tax=Mycoplasmopsis anatis 1340 TaxID=1034808 RepID=F9QEK3_9BACT|nr:NAD(P)-dependent oxidoreductase [Mycoplasmopsis anatis]AWX69962.1 lactate dehydrogenase [Mycoplasmopsis anatis]EGS28853.1 D-lactate dehydrogenase [Mycoplasmopsis anatis 1340]VEU73609.1 D-lactate dehydrogenase [Mycoplasmopsis anatis]